MKGIAEGKARIQVTATDDKHFTKEFEIKVKPIIYIESMEFVKEADKLALGETYTSADECNADRCYAFVHRMGKQ